MRSSALTVLTILWVTFSAEAQTDTAAIKPTYFLAFHAGGLVGKKGSGTLLTSSFIQGLRFNRLAIGLGIGYDAYVDWRMIPVFTSVNFDFSRYRGNSFFVQMNMGVSKAWSQALSNVEIVYNDGTNFNINPLLGYRIIGDKFNLHLSAGYKYQILEYGWAWSQGGNRTYVRRDIGRIAIQLGFGFR